MGVSHEADVSCPVRYRTKRAILSQGRELSHDPQHLREHPLTDGAGAGFSGVFAKIVHDPWQYTRSAAGRSHSS